MKPVATGMTFHREGAKVKIVARDCMADLGHEAARLLGRAMMRPLECEPPNGFKIELVNGVEPGPTGPVEVERVLVLAQGKLVADPPTAIAKKLGEILIGEAGLAEEHHNASRIPVSFAEGAPSSIIADQALAIRSGAPFGLSSNPRINDEAKKEAFGNRDLRRFLPEMKGKAVLGTPNVRQYSPDPTQAARETLANMSPEQREALARQAINQGIIQ